MTLSYIVVFIRWLWDLFYSLISYNQLPFSWLTRFLVLKIEIYLQVICFPFLSLWLWCNWDEGKWIVLTKNIESFIPLSQGVTYDTGGADVKAGGVMAGMSR